MKLFSALRLGHSLIFALVILLGCGTKKAVDAQVQSLSKITSQQIAKVLALPSEVAIYEPPADCYDLEATNPKCSGMDRARKLFAISDDGSPQLSECKSMRLFRFAGIKHLNLVTSLCQQGPFALPELNETRNRAQRVAKKFVEGVARLNPGKKPFSQTVESRDVTITNEATAHIFMVLMFGHGVGFLPTAVITSNRHSDTFVIQFFVIPESSNSDPSNPIVKLLSETTAIMESLARELYPATF
jgi:hypothetical protein